jgi:hypothetical protein
LATEGQERYVWSLILGRLVEIRRWRFTDENF